MPYFDDDDFMTDHEDDLLPKSGSNVIFYLAFGIALLGAVILIAVAL